MKDKEELSKFMVSGMIGGLFLGTIASIIFRSNLFILIAGTGFGAMIGMIVGIVVWGLKNNQ